MIHGTVLAPLTKATRLVRQKCLNSVVPKGGLEPPHPCGHMTLNHARLPIPPLRPGQGPHHTERDNEVKGPGGS